MITEEHFPSLSSARVRDRLAKTQAAAPTPDIFRFLLMLRSEAAGLVLWPSAVGRREC